MALRKAWGPAIEYTVRLADGGEARALAYAPQVGTPDVGERVLLSASAVARGLGTGGYMMIVAVPDRLPVDPPPSPGHIMKARYTPMQYMVQSVDEQESPYFEILKDADSIDGMPVVVADLHSALPAIVAGIHKAEPAARIAYIQTDGAALPAWFSQAARSMTDAGHILGTITAGQAYGGELEAINIHTALLAARLVWNADVAVVTQGPGNAGTGTKWGFSGTQMGEAINAAAVLGGQPIACLRASDADPRERHRGISHHTMRVLTDVVRVNAIVSAPRFDTSDPLMAGIDADVARKMEEQLEELSDLFVIDRINTNGLVRVLENAPAPLRSMGRGLAEDPLSFIAAGVAGVSAGKRVPRKPEGSNAIG
ncbi:hypothetical protein J2S49_000097 [Arcanobacterium wilhelmae]|uniref:DUF3866 family protein n=1 Tax=Arcanobacterium wilhelmae TaxID=1803177 RepID=A0ABT9N8I9_9ACTO|nr:DUF3866 family protein [Arcanobacterium wilhelmae]MDP9800021.1 hypothetical protein [Arcanobacterium wilhelmae]